MILRYKYRGNLYTFNGEWTARDGKSTIFYQVLIHLAQCHNCDAIFLSSVAFELDRLTDGLYDIIYAFNDSASAPYDPTLSGQIKKVVSRLSKTTEALTANKPNETSKLAAMLFEAILAKLQDIASVYLDEAAYRSKYRRRKRYKEQSTETTEEKQMAHEFEGLLNTVTGALDCLTEKQKKRVIKHYLLGYTLEEIALQEGAKKQSVQESIASARKKLQTIL